MELKAAEIKSVRIVEHIGVIVHSYAVKGLGCGIVTLFKGVHEYVDKRIDHKSTQKQECRQ